MVAVVRNPATAVWALLIALTAISWWLGADHGVGAGSRTAATSAVLVVAFLKVRFVGMHFMELRHAALPLRLAFEAWVVVVCAVIVGMYLWM